MPRRPNDRRPPLGPRPTRADLIAAKKKTVPDLIAPGLDVLFCGINPGLYTAAIGHHFGRPGNRFWKVLHLAGFTPRELSPFEELELLRHGCGVTNIVNRATARADELAPEDLIRGSARLRRTVRRWRPQTLAVLGMEAYRTAFGKRRVADAACVRGTTGATRPRERHEAASGQSSQAGRARQTVAPRSMSA